jgi:hypothetical protein
MESGKPSKEQIDFYYRTSKKYFDSLATQYMRSDREYYDKYFAPYVKGNLLKGSSKQKAASIITVMVILAIMGVVSAVLIYIGNSYKTDSDFSNEREKQAVQEYEVRSKTGEQKIITENESAGKFDTLAVSYMKSDFERGTYYYGRRDYEKAEEYLNRINKKDEDYLPSRDVLRRIQRERNNRSARKQPAEKIN